MFGDPARREDFFGVIMPTKPPRPAPARFSLGRLAAACLFVALPLSACSLAPDYVRPAAPVPDGLTAGAGRGAASPAPEGAPLPGWREFLPEPRLAALIDAALKNNRDLRAASLRILEARAELGMARAERLPMLEAMAGETAAGGAGRETSRDFEAALSLPSFEIDYLSRVGDMSRAALERYLGTVEAGRAARLALVSSVSEAYLSQRLAVERRRLTARNLASFESSRAFVEGRIVSGQSDMLDLEQARGMAAFARAQLAAREAEVVRTGNALSVWLGDFGETELPPPLELLKWPALQLPAAVRSETLLARPDVMEAEHMLMASNADIGAARAAFFPSISLTGNLGVMSMELSSLFGGGNEAWSFGPRITLPIFSGGRNMANLDLAEVRKDMAVVEYEAAVQTAFREVKDGLELRSRLGERLSAQADYLGTQRRVLALATNSYLNGAVSYLEVLEAQRNVLEAELELLEIKMEQIFNDISLYAALGGGFPDEPESPGDSPPPGPADPGAAAAATAPASARQ